MADGSMGDEEEYVDQLGVITALERTCELESRLRAAVQATHPLTTTLDWDFNAADKEREALLAIRCAMGAGRALGGCRRGCRRRSCVDVDSRRRALPPTAPAF